MKSSRHTLTPSGNPLRLNLHASFDTRSIVKETAPLPVFRMFAQSSLHRIAMNIAKLFHELPMVPDVEIVVAFLPEVFRLANQPPRHSLLERLDGIGEGPRNHFPTQANRWNGLVPIFDTNG